MSKAKEVLLVKVTECVKKDVDGELKVTLKVEAKPSNHAQGLSGQINRTVRLSVTEGAIGAYEAHVSKVTLKEEKETTGFTGVGVLCGGPSLEKLVGRAVYIVQAQDELPGV